MFLQGQGIVNERAPCFIDIEQAFDMGQQSIRFDREEKILGDLSAPFVEGLGPWHMVEGVVDFGRRKLTAIERQILTACEFLRVEPTTPTPIRPSRRSDPQPSRLPRSHAVSLYRCYCRARRLMTPASASRWASA